MAFLESDEIILRALEPEDLDALYKWENDSDLWHVGSTLAPYSRFVLREYLSNATQDIFQSHQLRLMIVEKSSGKAIGTVDLYDFDPLNLRAGVGVLLDADYRQKGYGSWTLRLMKEYAFRVLYLEQLYAYIPVSNKPSYQLFSANGYEESGLLRSWLKTDVGWEDVRVMQLHR